MTDLERWMRGREVRHISTAVTTGSGRHFEAGVDLVPGGGVILAGVLCLADALAVGAPVDARTLAARLPGVHVEEAYWLYDGAEPRLLYDDGDGWSVL